MKQTIYFILLSLIVTVASCNNNITLDIQTPEKIVMEVGDSLLLHGNGAKGYDFSTITSSNYNSFDDDTIPSSVVCYTKDIIVDGVRVLCGDEYLHAVRAGRDTLLVHYFKGLNRRTSDHRYPILVVDKQSTTKKTSRIDISL